MSTPNSPSPPPRPMQLGTLRSKPQLPSSPVFSTPSFSSTLPLPRPLSASGAFRRTSVPKKSRMASSQNSRRTRSVASSAGHSGDGSLGEFSMENYTVDLAQLGKNQGTARPIGFEQAFHDPRKNKQDLLKEQDAVDADDEEEEEEIVQYSERSEDRDGSEEEEEEGEEAPNDFMDGYEIDLGGLGDKPSSVFVEDPINPREELPSEDEGPEDFTQNLEAWMRGTKTSDRDQPEDIAVEHEPDRDPEQDLREAITEKEAIERSVSETPRMSTPAPTRNHAIIDKGVEEEARLQAPPLSRLNTEMLQDKAAEEVFERISALQAEVESMRMEDEIRRAAYEALVEEHEKMNRENESAKNDFQVKYTALQAENDGLKQAGLDVKEALRRENRDLTREYNNVMEQLRLLEKQALPNQDTNTDKLKENYHRAVQELEVCKLQAETDRNAAKSQIEQLSGDLRDSRDELSTHKTQSDSIHKQHSISIEHLEADLDARRKEVALERKESVDRANEAVSLAESNERKEEEISRLVDQVHSLKSELGQAREQLKETRRIVEDVEEENDRLTRENQVHVERIAELESIVKEKGVVGKASAPMAETQNIIDEATHKAHLEEMSCQRQATLNQLGTDHSKEIQPLRKSLLKPSEGMQKREAKLTKVHQDQVASLNHEITTLTAQQAKASETSSTTDKELRSAIRVLSAKLERANATAESARAEAEAARQQAEDAEQANAIVNAELELRFAETIEVREEEWRRRVDLLFKERERMGKALMWGWGREERGSKGMAERGQEYRYRFLKKV